MQRWCVVGGGMLGLDIARQLAGRGHRVEVWEASTRLGGLAAPWQIGDVVWDRFYHVIAGADSTLLALLRTIGIDGEIQWIKAQTGFYTGGRLHRFSTVPDFARFPALTPLQKARLALTILYASRITDWRPLEDVTAVQWLTQLSGRQVVERIWLPLLRAKLGENAERVSAAFIWTIIRRMYGARQTNTKQECFGVVRDGYARVLSALLTHLQSLRIELFTQRAVASIESSSGGAKVYDGNGVCERFDGVVVTVPAPQAVRCCPQLSAEERQRLCDIEYQGVICASLLLRQPLSPFYITNITDPAPFTAVIEMDALTGTQPFAGSALVYLPKYVAAGDAAFELDDDALKAMFVGALLRMYPTLSLDDVVTVRIARARHVLPLSTLGYSQRVPAFITSVPNLYIANSSQIVNGTLNVNQTLMLAQTAMEAIDGDVATRTTQPEVYA